MIRVRQLKLPVEHDNIEELKNKICKKLTCHQKDILDIKITKKSIDARNKPNIYFIYEVDINIKKETLNLMISYYHQQKNIFILIQVILN